MKIDFLKVFPFSPNNIDGKETYRKERITWEPVDAWSPI